MNAEELAMLDKNEIETRQLKCGMNTNWHNQRHEELTAVKQVHPASELHHFFMSATFGVGFIDYDDRAKLEKFFTKEAKKMGVRKKTFTNHGVWSWEV